MTLEAGAQIWVPCEVKPGPFSNERLVRVRDSGREWLGFVQANRLKEPILEGATFIGALVVSVNGEKFKARMPGEAVTPGLFEGAVARVRPLGAAEPDIPLEDGPELAPRHRSTSGLALTNTEFGCIELKNFIPEICHDTIDP